MVKASMNGTLKAVVFPGQGAQYRGMGRDLFDDYAPLVRRADEMLGYSIKELCLQDPERRLNDTRYTQPALYVVNALLYLRHIESEGARPDLLAGHSLGEYSALFAAGAFDFETGLRLVMQRGELMSRASGGMMAAALNISAEALIVAISEERFSGVDIANYNSLSQTVLSGPADQVNDLRPIIEAVGGTFLPLNVSAPFHSRYMQGVADEFAEYIRELVLDDPEIPVVSNVGAKPYLPGQVRQNLVEQIRSPVRWLESVWFLMGSGDVQIRELGPKDTLSRMIKQIAADGVPKQRLR
jgi:trans-AT polyketide synthase/acyltransferase/oxidoreductase domain-containing protein